MYIKDRGYIDKIKKYRDEHPDADQINWPGITISKGKGIYLEDVDGKKYIDFAAQSHNIGYAHPNVQAAVDKELKDGGYSHITKYNLTEKLKEIAGGRLSTGIVQFASGGSDSTEVAIKAIKSCSKGRGVMFTYLGAYLGGTISTLALTMDDSELKRGLHPLPLEVAYVPYPYCYRCAFGKEYPDCEFQCLDYLRYIFDTVAHPLDTAALFMEPIQAHGGLVIPPDEYFGKIRSICDQHNIIFVADEIVTGFGRTGKMFAMANWAVEPDMMTMGKPIAAGLPMGAVLARGEVTKFLKGTGSAAGHSVCCAASLAMIEVILREKLTDNALKVGGHMMKRLREMQKKYEIIGDVRGKGLLIGVEMVKDKKSKKPLNARNLVIHSAAKKGLLMRCGGTYHQSLRITPPLNIEIEEADDGLDILDETFKEADIKS